MKKKGFVQILIPLIIILLAVGGWYLFTTQKIQVKDNPQPSSNSDLKEFTTKGIFVNSKLDFPKLSFNHPSDWTVKEDASPDSSDHLGQDNTTVTKNGYTVRIDQELRTGTGVCYFKDSPTATELNAPGADLQTVTYQEMNSNFGHLRYFRWLSENSIPANSYGFCAKHEVKSKELSKSVYVVPSVGYVYLTVPAGQLNDVIFQEALNIIKSITAFQ